MIGQPVILRTVSGGGFDQYGDPLPETIVDTEVMAMVAPRESSESDVRGRNGSIVGLTAYLPPGVDATAADRIIVDALEYVIDSEPGKWHRPSTGAHWGTQVALKRATG